MLSNELAAILAPFAQMANRNALSAAYKTLEISPAHIRGASPWGILDAAVETGIGETFWIDAISFINVVKSLPKEEISFTIKGGALHWDCGLAEGKLGLPGAEIAIPNADWKTSKKKSRSPDKQFIQALSLGSLSCGPESMMTAGLHGVVIDNAGAEMAIVSSDDVTMSMAIAGESNPLLPEKTALKPEAADMLQTILAIKAGEPSLYMDEKSVFASNDIYRLMLRPAPAFRVDIAGMVGNYADRQVMADIPRDRVAAFIRRATALAENKQHTFVTLSAINGGLALAFAEGAATSDEVYVIDDLPEVGDLPDIQLDAMRIARVLAHTSRICLDYIDRGVIAFCGDDPKFDYLVNGIESRERTNANNA